ncbi:hypothetical protein [Actinospongicola halichondriae]|uniref:hypothetical protein n=1 Tax=Actinospongicola halichondriae TaxID=3236844 RepID=UPI003D44819C
MNATDMVPDPYAQRARRRRGLWIALAVTAVAVPVLVIDNLPGSDPEPDPLTEVRIVTPSDVPRDRAESGPRKGVSVVTSSTTSSTLPITTTTTTTTTLPF